MTPNVTLYNLLISCPGDIKSELTLIESAVDEFNEFYAETLGIMIKTRHWSKSSYAQSGGKPQALLNEQFITKCDAAVAIMWTKFGSPTDEYGSGTEEEIEIMLQSGKQVFMYFSDKPIPPSQMNGEEYKKIQDFRKKYKDRGVYFTYSSDEELKKLVFAHLSMYFLSKKKVNDSRVEKTSQLKLMGIDQNGNLNDHASIYPFVFNAEITTQQYIDSICAMYREITGMNVGRRNSVANPALLTGFSTPVEIAENERNLIRSVAEQLELDLSEEFFELGNLCKDSFSSNVLSGPHLKGTDKEKDKYWKIRELHKTINEVLDWSPIEKAYVNRKCIRLAIQNYGKAVDEDVEISLTIPQEVFVSTGDFPELENYSVEYLMTDCDMETLFGINGTYEYSEFSTSKKSVPKYQAPRPYGLPGYTPNYRRDYLEELDKVFCYEQYDSGDNCILKLKVDYIKHHTTVAFPTVLFIRGGLTEIPYKITSKNNPDLVEGVLQIT